MREIFIEGKNLHILVLVLKIKHIQLKIDYCNNYE